MSVELQRELAKLIARNAELEYEQNSVSDKQPSGRKPIGELRSILELTYAHLFADEREAYKSFAPLSAEPDLYGRQLVWQERAASGRSGFLRRIVFNIHDSLYHFYHSSQNGWREVSEEDFFPEPKFFAQAKIPPGVTRVYLNANRDTVIKRG